MTTKGEWKVYTGSDEQIAELKNAKNGYILKNTRNQESEISKTLETNALLRGSNNRTILLNCSEVTHYLICNPHPLADMICQQARTGQPVWFKDKKNGRTGKCLDNGSSIPHPFYAPEHYEYRFTPFED